METASSTGSWRRWARFRPAFRKLTKSFPSANHSVSFAAMAVMRYTYFTNMSTATASAAPGVGTDQCVGHRHGGSLQARPMTIVKQRLAGLASLDALICFKSAVGIVRTRCQSLPVLWGWTRDAVKAHEPKGLRVRFAWFNVGVDGLLNGFARPHYALCGST